jgi:hypothetical protein
VRSLLTMNSDLSGRPFRSKRHQFVAGDEISVQMDFLAPARHMTAPEVEELIFAFSGTVTPDADAEGADAAKLIKNVKFTDEAEVVNASGTMLRLLEQVETGNKQRDPADMTVVGGATAVKYRLRLLFAPLDHRAERPRDFAVPLAHFLEGGNLIVSLADVNPTGWGAVANDWRMTVFARVRDGRVRELKSRRRILEQVVNNQEFDYQINGALRSAILGSKKTTTGYDDLSGFDTLYSRTLDLPPSMDTHIIVDEYVKGSDGLGANDEFEAGYAIPLKVPSRRQKIGQMIQTSTLHIDLEAAPSANMRLLTDTVVDRAPNMAALSEGYGSAEALALAVQQNGVIVGASGNYPANQAPPHLARKLPIRVK